MTAKGKLIRNIIIAVVAIALLGGGYYFALKWEPEKKDPENEDKPIAETIYIISEKAEDVSKIHIVNSKAEYDIERTEDGESPVYSIPSITGGDGISSAISGSFGALIKMSATNKIEKGAENAESFGLAKPQASYTVFKKDGSEISVLIGDEVPTGGEFYCMTEGGDTIYTIGAYKAEVVNRVPDDYRNISIMMIEDPQKVTDFTLYKGNEMVMDIRLATDEENDKKVAATIWAMDYPWTDDVSDTNLVRLFQKLAVIEATGFPEDGAAFVPEYRFDIATPEQSRSFSLSGTLLRDEATGIIYTVDKSLADTIGGIVPNDYLGKVVKLADIEKVSRVVVSKDGKEYIMEPGDEEGKAYVINGTEVDASEFKKSYQAVIGVYFKERGDYKVSGEPYLAITYELKDGTTDFVKYYEIDESEYIAVRSDGSTVKVLRSALSEIEKLFENI